MLALSAYPVADQGRHQVLGMKPPQYLKEGDVMELAIEGLGSQRQTVVAAKP